MADRSPYMLALVLLLATGCVSAPPVEIHPRFVDLCPKTVHVSPAKNESFRTDLETFRPEARLQQLLTGGNAINVLTVFHDAARRSVENRGYRLQETSEGAKDGELRVSIEDWREAPSSGASEILVIFRLALILPDSGETLYSNRIRHRIASKGSSRRLLMPMEIRREIGKAVEKGLSSLPVCN